MRSPLLPASPSQIHDANVYVTAAMRQRLWEEEGIRGYRFVQREGEAVFIPAGCPHQA